MSQVETSIFLPANSDTRIPVDDVVSWMLSTFSGAYVAAENSFEAERERYRRAGKILEQQPELRSGFDLVISSSYGKEKRCGPGKDIVIPVTKTGVYIKGRVWGSSIYLFAPLPARDPVLQCICSFLRNLNVGDISIDEEAI